MAEYEELDPFKTNEFQVGDLVRVFTVGKSGEKPIKETIQGTVEKVDGDFILLGGEDYLFYQARKLREIGPKLFWFKALGKTINGRESYHVIDFDPRDPTWTQVQTV